MAEHLLFVAKLPDRCEPPLRTAFFAASLWSKTSLPGSVRRNGYDGHTQSNIQLTFFMADFFKTSTIWVVDFRYDGRARRWFKAFRANDDVPREMAARLRDLYGTHVQVVEVRKATEEEILQYLRGEEPKNVFCPTGR